MNDYVALRQWPREQADKNQQQQVVGSASGSSQNASEWRAWPEFDFFHAQLSVDAAAAAESAEGQSGGDSESGDTSRKVSKFRVSEPAAAAARPDEARQLLELQADETITTSANVLQLAELVRGQEQLECQASNMHYDLRALIRLYAPAALSAEPLPAPKRRDPLAGPSRTRAGQLVEAIERSLAASLRPVAAKQQQQQQTVAAATTTTTTSMGDNQDKQAPAGGQLALKQIKPDETQGPKLAPDAWPSSESPGGSSQGSAWPSVIYQQLVRPHQLSEQAAAAASTASGFASDGQVATAAPTLSGNSTDRSPPPSPLAKQATGLARSKLIALDTYCK